jgi:hypothetical protein
MGRMLRPTGSFVKHSLIWLTLRLPAVMPGAWTPDRQQIGRR